jgi:phosphatidylglycerophosphate synthase
MLDGVMRRLIDPVLVRVARQLAANGLKADHVTLAGFVLGMGCAVMIVVQWDGLALLLLALGRFADGLDGALARATRVTDRGGFLDVTLDFLFYGSIPLAFALRDPAQCALPATVLLAAFYANGASFLAFSALAAKRGMESTARGPKSLYFTTGLAEGTETIAFFTAFILFPQWFGILAYAFAVLCMITCLARVLLGWRVFGVDDRAN